MRGRPHLEDFPKFDHYWSSKIFRTDVHRHVQEKHVRLEAVDGIAGPEEPLAAMLNGENRPMDYLRLIEVILPR